MAGPSHCKWPVRATIVHSPEASPGVPGTMGAMPTDVRNNPAASRYELFVDGALVGIADYEVVDDRVVFPHTEIVRERRGQGLGAVLVRGALDDVRSTGRSVVPQ